MLGSIIGDTVGSRYEYVNHRSKYFVLFSKACRFTDDTVCTLAVGETLMNNYPISFTQKGLAKIKKELVENFIKYVKKYPDVGYGGMFHSWATESKDHQPYNSFGNGSAMRIAPVGWLANSKQEVIKLSRTVSEVTHNHPEGIKGAEAIAMCIYLARKGKSKEKIKEYIYDHYYPIIEYLDYNVLLKSYRFDVSCEGSVPEAIYAFLISNSFEDTIRTAVSIGGDTDTIACMAGSIAEAYYRNKETELLLKEFMSKDYLGRNEKKLVNRFYRLIKNTNN